MMVSDYTYEASRMANFGRDTAKAHSTFTRSTEKLAAEINAAIDNGIKPIKVAHDVMGRCSSREMQIELLSSLMALAQMNKIPQSVVDPFEGGIRVKRV
jgi:hypothetical protein